MPVTLSPILFCLTFCLASHLNAGKLSDAPRPVAPNPPSQTADLDAGELFLGAGEKLRLAYARELRSLTALRTTPQPTLAVWQEDGWWFARREGHTAVLAPDGRGLHCTLQPHEPPRLRLDLGSSAEPTQAISFLHEALVRLRGSNAPPPAAPDEILAQAPPTACR